MEISKDTTAELDQLLQGMRDLTPEEIERLANEARALRAKIQEELDDSMRIPNWMWHILIT